MTAAYFKIATSLTIDSVCGTQASDVHIGQIVGFADGFCQTESVTGIVYQFQASDVPIGQPAGFAGRSI